MPLITSKAPPPLPTSLPVGETNTKPAHLAKLSFGGKTYNLTLNTAEPIMVAPPIPSTLPVGDVSCFARPGELSHREKTYPLRRGETSDLTILPCITEARTRLQDLRENTAARIIVNALRQSVANNVHTYMIGSGSHWKDTPKESAQNHIKTLSAKNYSEVKAYLGALRPLEKAFFDTFMATSLIAVHCTNSTPENGDGTLCLYS